MGLFHMNKKSSIVTLFLIAIAAHLEATPLGDAIYRDSRAEVRRLITENPESLEEEYEGSRGTPLYLAAQYGRTEIVGILLEAGASINQGRMYRDECSARTPLAIAVWNKHAGAVMRLCRAGASREALHIPLPADILAVAAYMGIGTEVDALIQEGHPIVADAVHEAADWGDLEILQRLINAGGPVEAARIGTCRRNHRWYLGALPILLRAAGALSDESKQVIASNISTNSGWNNAQKQTMLAMVERNAANL
jgi:hypothetical protein